MKILGTGLSGLIGSRVVDLLSPEFSFENLSLETGVDITDQRVVRERVGASDAPWVFHFAAKTDVDGCEAEKKLKEKSDAWIVNVLGTEYLVEACRQTGKKLLFLSTDYVFDGAKDEYGEDDPPNPLGWYAITKYEGEKRVCTLGKSGVIARIANPYKAGSAERIDFVHKIATLLSQGKRVLSPNDQLFVPTFIDDIAHALVSLVRFDAAGIFHVVGSLALTPYDAAQTIAKTFGYDPALVVPTTFKEYFRGRASRPFRAVLKNDKISEFGIHMSTFHEGLKIVKEQERRSSL